MKVYYDLHIHTALSPCADDEMTPNNIVNMSLLTGLDCIAITDHNTCGNARAVIEAAEGSGLVVIPGMEVETAEEVHVVCLFPDVERAQALETEVKAGMPQIKLKEEIYGKQLFYDSEDEITGCYDSLLIVASGLGIYELAEAVKKHNGVMIPAHIDRSSYSVISNLGDIPPDLGIQVVELSMSADASKYAGYDFIRSSDAHYLHQINERVNFLELDASEGFTAEDVLRALTRFHPQFQDHHFQAQS